MNVLPDSGGKVAEIGVVSPDVVVWPYLSPTDFEVTSIQIGSLNDMFGATWFLRIYADGGGGKPATPPMALVTTPDLPASTNTAAVSLSMKGGVTYWIGVGTNDTKTIFLQAGSNVTVPMWYYDGVPATGWQAVAPTIIGRPATTVVGTCP
jgi:hypothetical protein